MAKRLTKLDQICIALIVIMSLAAGIWVARQCVKKKQQMEYEKQVLTKTKKDLHSAEARLLQLRSLLESQHKELRLLNERIPDSAKIGEFLKQLDNLMKKRKLALVSLEPLPTTRQKHYTRIPIRLMFRGPFVRVYRLIRDIEAMNRVVVMEKMMITKTERDEDCLVGMTASVFEH
jgi:Tfp pilus assembly protein PilO